VAGQKTQKKRSCGECERGDLNPHGIAPTMKYDKVQRILGVGNFVLVMCEGEFSGEHVAYYDLFRVE
jgi:hypothetical protein